MSYKKLFSSVGEKYLGWYGIVNLKELPQEFARLYGDDPFPTGTEMILLENDAESIQRVVFKADFTAYLTDLDLKIHYGVLAIDEGTDEMPDYQPVSAICMIVPEGSSFKDMDICQSERLLEHIQTHYLSKYMSMSYLETKRCVVFCDSNPY